MLKFLCKECVGKSSEIRSCDPVLPECIELSEWSEWSTCKVKCDKNVSKQNRTRICIAGDCNSSAFLLEEQDCKNNVFILI